MLIGIISDTHDRLGTARKALSLFKEDDVSVLVHAGDFISPFVIPLFKDFQVYGTFGNNDGEKEGLLHHFSSIKATVTEYFCKVTQDNLRIAVTHGHIPSLLELLVNSHLYDVVVTGHTHHPEIRGGDTILINPGECCGYVTDRCTVVVFDTQKKKGEVIDI